MGAFHDLSASPTGCEAPRGAALTQISGTLPNAQTEGNVQHSTLNWRQCFFSQPLVSMATGGVNTRRVVTWAPAQPYTHAQEILKDVKWKSQYFPCGANIWPYIYTHNLGNRRGKKNTELQEQNVLSSLIMILIEVKECVEFSVTISLHGRHLSDVTQAHKHAQIRPGCVRLWHHSPAQRACVCMSCLCGVILTEYRPVEVWTLHCSWILLPCFPQALLSQCKQKSS